LLGAECATPGDAACAGTFTLASHQIYTNTGGVCPVGYYCPEGSGRPLVCTPGMMCTATELGEPDALCPAGKYCIPGTDNASVLPKDCPAGYYCPAGSDRPWPCPAGTYSAETLDEALLDCELCTAGWYCPDVAMD